MDAKQLNLGDLLKDIKSGKVQLPDFQRSWIWDDGKIKSLLESVIRGFPINSIMLLECDAADMKFSYRPINLLKEEKPDAQPQFLILDGQQRLTSLYGALFADKPVEISKGKDKSYFYYVDMQKAIDAVKTFEPAEDMIISLPPNRKLKAKGVNWDLSTPEKEFAASMFPLNKIFDGSLLNWILAYTAHYSDDIAKKNLINEFNENIILKISRYEIVAIKLAKSTPLEAICNIFEKVNVGGEKLGVFDLLTAIFAAKKNSDGTPIELRKDWQNVQETFEELTLLSEVDCSDFVTALTLLASYEKFRQGATKIVTCKGADILKLAYTDYVKYKGDIIAGFVEAAKFLEEAGVTNAKYLPYKSQLVPLAAIFAELKITDKDNIASRNKIRQWYWCGVFGESYKDGQGGRYAKDIVQVIKWLDRREEPEIIRKTQIGAKRLMSVKTATSAAYKGMILLILKNGATDFLVGKNMGSGTNYAENIEVHHIFPKKYCDEHGLPKDKYDFIANRTLILKKTNQIIGGNPPSVYLQKIERKIKLSSAEVDEILERHFIDAALCRADNFDAFIADRAKKIFAEIEKLTGREVIGKNF